MRNGPVSEKAPVGVFVGLATLDVIHRIAKPPAVNEKITSTAQFVAAGGREDLLLQTAALIERVQPWPLVATN